MAKSALPTPASAFLPAEYQTAPEFPSLAAAIDRAMQGIQGDIIGMRDIIVAESCPSQLLIEVGALLNAGVLVSDTDRTKRSKVAGAVHGQKSHGLWTELKEICDAISGANAVMYLGISADWPVRIGDLTAYNLGNMWSLRGGAGDGFGIIRTGGGTEAIVPGNIYVDVGTNALTADQVSQIVGLLKYDVAPAYYHVFIGYTTAGVFTMYAGGQIG
jgi:hypothetical protein